MVDHKPAATRGWAMEEEEVDTVVAINMVCRGSS